MRIAVMGCRIRGKYNPIERLGRSGTALERTLLLSVHDVLQWAGTMTWRAIHPIVGEIATLYRSGVRLTKADFRAFEQRWERSESLRKWSLIIRPA
ncbi:MAG TPA: hypothetical protein VGI99_15075 [Gemmataceae bacterium]|jgi:hypothetical protein